MLWMMQKKGVQSMSEMEMQPSEPQQPETMMEDEPQGSVIRGILGALLGALAGGVVFALLFAAGMIHAVVGLVIGFLSTWLYTKFGGRQGWMQVVAVLAAVVIGVSVGIVGGYTMEFLKWHDEPDTDTDLTRGEYVQTMWERVVYDQTTFLGREYDRYVATLEDGETFWLGRDQYVTLAYDDELDDARKELRDEMLKNWLMGLAFSFLGCLGTLTNAVQQAKQRKQQTV